MPEQTIIAAFRNRPGGIGNFLTVAQKEAIRRGPVDTPEKHRPYDIDLLMHSFDYALDNHPIWIKAV